MRQLLVSLLLLSLLIGTALLPAGCERRGGRHSKDHDDSMLTASTKYVFGEDSPNGEYEAFFSPRVWPLPLNEVFTMEVSIVDNDGELIQMPFTVDADMPEHNHGMNTQPELIVKEPGSVRVDGMLFHMPGDWEVYAHIELGETIETVTWKVKVELQ